LIGYFVIVKCPKCNDMMNRESMALLSLVTYLTSIPITLAGLFRLVFPVRASSYTRSINPVRIIRAAQSNTDSRAFHRTKPSAGIPFFDKKGFPHSSQNILLRVDLRSSEKHLRVQYFMLDLVGLKVLPHHSHFLALRLAA